MSDERNIEYRDINRNSNRPTIGDKQTPAGNRPAFMQWQVPPAFKPFDLRVSKKKLEADAAAACRQAAEESGSGSLLSAYSNLTDIGFARAHGAEAALDPLKALELSAKQLGGTVTVV